MKHMKWYNQIMKLPKKVYLVAAILVFVAGGATVYALQPEPATQKEDTVQLTNTVAEPETPVQQEVVVEQEAEKPAAPKTPVPQATEPEPVVNTLQQGSPEWHVFNRRSEVGKPLPASAKTARQYCEELMTIHSYAPSNTPVLHGVSCWKAKSSADRGHMAFVEQVNADGSIWVSEMNSRGQKSITDSTPYGGWGKVDYKLIPADSLANYQFLN